MRVSVNQNLRSLTRVSARRQCQLLPRSTHVQLFAPRKQRKSHQRRRTRQSSNLLRVMYAHKTARWLTWMVATSGGTARLDGATRARGIYGNLNRSLPHTVGSPGRAGAPVRRRRGTRCVHKSSPFRRRATARARGTLWQFDHWMFNRTCRTTVRHYRDPRERAPRAVGAPGRPRAAVSAP